MAQAGSVSATTVKALTDSSYQNECKSATARVNCCCASALQETGKPTSPTLPMACACNAVGASDAARAEASSALRSEIRAIVNTPVRVSDVRRQPCRIRASRLSARLPRLQPSIYARVTNDHLNLAGRDGECRRRFRPAVIAPE